MKDGFKIWDTDTHVRPSLESLEPYYDPAFRARLPELEPYKRVNNRDAEGMVIGRHSYSFPEENPFRRTLGRVEAGVERPPHKYQGHRFASTGAIDDDADARIRDQDEEGVDCQLLIGGSSSSGPSKDVDIAVGFMRAYNRYLNDYCGKHPHRLKAVLPIVPGAVDACVAEIKEWGKTPWAVGVYPNMANDTPLDHPDLEPIWKAADELGLAVIHHSHFSGPPWFPGYQDLWNSPFLGRSASHPWGAMRAIGAFIGAGVLERYRALRFGILECGCGWLPFWMRRLDDQAEYVGGVPHLDQTIGEQMTGGRFFAALEMAEGEDMIQMVNDFMGTGVLMYASDYPHMECRFPESVNYFMKWDVSDDVRRKLFWENPVRFYGEP
jgi:predicted TIM-barrel fold metal-dependent hydrolase